MTGGAVEGATASRASRIGAVFYALWGLLHVVGGAAMLSAFASGGGAEMLRLVATALPAAEIANPSVAVASVLAFHAWNLLWLGGLVMSVAVTLGWRGRTAGYWINLAVVAAVDGGLLGTTVLPGVMRVADAIPGLALFALALAFSTVGMLASPALRARESPVVRPT